METASLLRPLETRASDDEKRRAFELTYLAQLETSTLPYSRPLVLRIVQASFRDTMRLQDRRQQRYYLYHVFEDPNWSKTNLVPSTLHSTGKEPMRQAKYIQVVKSR